MHWGVWEDPLARPAPHNPGPLWNSLSLFPTGSLSWQLDIPRGILSTAGETPTTTAALDSSEPGFWLSGRSLRGAASAPWWSLCVMVTGHSIVW